MDEPQTSSESFPQFKEIDDVLKCGICYETLVTPVITSCSHTFCSLCIRRWLSSKQICPSCSESIYEAGLRKNTIVGNILDAVVNLKNKISRKNGRSASGSGSSSCPKNEDEDFQPKISVKKAPPATPKQSRAPPEPKPTPIVPKTPPVQRSPVVQPKTPLTLRSPMMAQRSPEVESTPRERPQPVEDERSPAIKVACPVCDVVMPQRLMNDHLDRCLLDPKPRPRSSEPAKLPSTQLSQKSSPKFINPTRKNIPNSSTSAESRNPPLQPIKTKVYNLMSDKQIKAELKKYGLAAQGDRRTIVSRLQKFVILHNAECDSDRPRSLVELRQHLEKEEKAVSSASVATNFSQMFKKTNNPEEIENANKDYMAQNKSSFQRLIEDVRNRKKNKPPPKEEPITLSDTEDDPEPAPIQNPVPAKPGATSPFKVDSETDCEIAPAKSPKQRTKIISKKKRKCIESESEEEDNDDDDGVFKKLKRQEKRVEEATSPVLSRKTPARQLRSRTVQTRTGKKEIETPQVTARNSKRGKQAPKQIMTRVVPKDDLSSSDEDVSVIKKGTAAPNPVKDRSPTPDFFDASPSSSRCSSLPCGQRVKNDSDINDGDGSENDALDTLVEMIENEDAGSTTDFED